MVKEHLKRYMLYLLGNPNYVKMSLVNILTHSSRKEEHVRLVRNLLEILITNEIK